MPDRGLHGINQTLAALCCAVCCCWSLPAQEPPAADRWLDHNARYPLGVGSVVDSNRFANLHAEAVAGAFKIVWPAEEPVEGETFFVYVSAAEIGHWAARDWQSCPVSRSGVQWTAAVPIDDIEVPLAYFVKVIRPGASGAIGATNVSPMRMVIPAEVGLEEPTRRFWPFLEGFEHGPESWRILSGTATNLNLSEVSRTGLAALLVSLPPERRTVTVATTRVRGWQLRQSGATGLRLWLRTRAEEARARFTLHADAFTAGQTVALNQRTVPVRDQWRRVDLLLADFPKLPLDRVDLFSIEFISDGAKEFLIDDLQLLGPWEPEP